MREFERREAIWISPHTGKRYVYPGKGTSRLVNPDEWAHTGRTLRLTPKGEREAFLQALDRVYRIPGGGCR
jgi:hypothetical protein